MGERLAPSQIVLTNFRVHRNQLNNGLRVRGRERVESGVGREGAGDHVNDEGKFEMARNALLHRNSTYIYISTPNQTRGMSGFNGSGGKTTKFGVFHG